MDTNTTQTPIAEPGGYALWNLAGSCLVFAGVFFALLLLSLLLSLPRIVSLGIQGNLLPGQDLHAKREALHEDIASLERARERYILPSGDALHTLLHEQKHAQGSLRDIFRHVEDARARLSGERDDVIVIDRMVFEQETDAALHLDGRVQHVGPRSMTTLVSFVEALEQIPLFSVREQPHFTRIQEKSGGFFSPFSFVLDTHSSLE